MYKRQVQAEMTKGIPLGRVGQPDDVANAVAFLAAEQSGYLTGQVLCVDAVSYTHLDVYKRQASGFIP